MAFGLLPESGQAAGPDQGTAVTLADVAGQAAIQAQQSVTPADRLQPLETVGAKGGVPQPVVSNQTGTVLLSESVPAPQAAEPEMPEMPEQAASEGDRSKGSEPFMERLSRIMADMNESIAPSETVPVPQPVQAPQQAAVPDELVIRLHARSLAEGAGRGDEVGLTAAASRAQAAEDKLDLPVDPVAPEAALREFMPVVAAPEPTVGSEQALAAAPDATPEAEAAEKAATAPRVRDDTVRFQATGLTLADMAMEVTPAPAKQAVPPLAPAAVPLARLIVPRGGSVPAFRPTLRQTALATPRFVLPGARLAPRARPRLALRFPDPRSLDSGLGVDQKNRAWRYPASASLARFLGGIERMPVPTRGRAIMPVNLQQIARQAQGARAAATRVRRPAPGFSFSFSNESFAGNHLTGQSAISPTLGATGRRQAVMNELRRVFTSVR